MSDIELRVDKAFSSAVEHQLDEQREIRRLVSRVDETLIALSDGMVDLAGQLDDAAQRIGGVAATPEDVEQARAEVVEHVGRMGASVSQLERELLDKLAEGDQHGQRLLSTVSDTRADLLEALARLERDTAPVAEAVEDTRREVIGALHQISDILSTERDQEWAEAVARLDTVIARSVADQHQDREATAAALASWQEQAAEAIGALASRAQDALHRAASQAAEDVAARDLATMQDLAGDVTASSGEVAERVERAANALSTAVSATSGEVAERVEHATSVLSAAVEATREDVVQEVARANQGLSEDLAQAHGGFAQRLATSEAMITARVEAAGSEVAEQVNASTQALGATVERSGQDVLARVVGIATDVAARHEDMLERLESVARLAADVAPANRQGLEDMAVRLADLVREQRDVAVSSIAELAATRGATPDEVSDLVAGLVSHLETVVAERMGSIGQASSHATTAMVTATERLDAASSRHGSQIAELSDAIIARLESTTSRSLTAFEGTAERLASQTREATEQALTTLVETQTSTSERVREATDLLSQAATGLQPQVAGALEELRTILLGQAQADRAQVEGAIASLAEASTAARDGVLGAVGRATARLAEVQAEGIGRMTAVADHLDGVPESISPPILSLVEHVQAGVADAIGHLQRSTAEATQQAVAALSQSTSEAQRDLSTHMAGASAEVAGSWDRLIAVQRTEAERLEGATAAISLLGSELAPGVRQALQEVREALQADLQGQHEATRGLSEGIVSAAAQIEDRMSAATDTMGLASHEATGVLREAADGVGEALRQAAEAAASRVEASQTDSLLALTTATNRLQSVNDEIPQVMASARSGLTDALAAARVEIEALLSRTDDRTAARISELVDTASREWMAKVDQQGAALSIRAAQVLEATAGITPAVDDLITRLRTEVAVVATDVLADLQEPVVEAGRVAAEMEPAIATLLSNLQIALHEVATRTSETSGAASAQARDMLLEAVAVMQRNLAGEVARTESSVREASRSIAAATAHGEQELREAAAALTEVAGRLEPGVAAVVQELRSELLTRATQDDEHAVARIASLREAVDVTADTLRSHVESASGASQQVISDLETVSDRTRAAIEEGLEAARDQLAATMESHLASLADHLNAAGADAAAQTEALQMATARMTVGVDAALVGVAAQVKESSDVVQQHLVEAAEALVARMEQHSSSLREQLTSQIAEAAARVDAASMQSGQTSSDLVNISADVVESMHAAVGELSGQVSGQMDGLLEAAAGQLDAVLRGNAEELQHQTASMVAHLQRLEGLEVAAADRVEHLVQDVTSRLTGEMMTTRDAIRLATATDEDTASQAVVGISAQVDRVLAEVPEQVRALLADGVRSRPIAQDQQRILDQRLEAMERRLLAAMAAERDHDGRSDQLLEQAAARLEDITDRLQGSQDAELAEIRAGVRADADALLDALAVRADEVLTALSDRAEQVVGSLGGSIEDAATAQELVAGLDLAVARMQQTTGQLERLGPRMEQQSTVRIDGVVSRVQAAISEINRALEGVDRVDDVVAAALQRGLADLRRATPSPAPRSYPAPTTPRPTSAATDHGGMVPPAPRSGSDTVCADCGFVARTPPGLAAHRRTCVAAERRG